MMKRKVSVIWVVVLALIAIAACAFAAVTYYRCGKQPEPQFPENELLRILDAGSDAEGVGSVSYTHLTLPTTIGV